MNSFANKFPHLLVRWAGHALMAVVALSSVAPSYAVTDKEMDNAKAIAAKFYIRYANDGAGYLDGFTPGSMAELEKKLSTEKDRQLLRQFKGAGAATDYASWGKDQLVAYWSDAFFKENLSKLDAKGAANGLCKKQIKENINKLAIAAAPAPQPEAQQPAEPVAAHEADSAKLAQEAAVADNLDNVADEIADAQEMVDREQESLGREPERASGTWVYIMILAILVGVVIFLVVYASRTMKGEPKEKARKQDADADDDDDVEAAYAPAPVIIEQPARANPADDTQMREKYAQTLASKAEEIRALTRQLSEMESLAASLKEENRRLKAELERARREERNREETRPVAAPAASAGAGSGHVHEIYLGRVNSQGVFVRADRHAVDGQSIFKLTTTDGLTGTYALINNPLIEEQVLDDPGKWLAGGCFAKDIFDTEGREGIQTETPGKAVFRDRMWQVEKKSRIRYI